LEKQVNLSEENRNICFQSDAAGEQNIGEEDGCSRKVRCKARPRFSGSAHANRIRHLHHLILLPSTKSIFLEKTTLEQSLESL